MLRQQLRRMVKGLAKRMVRSSPRIPGEAQTARTRPTTRAEWKPESESESESESAPELELSAHEIQQRMAAGNDVVFVDVRERHELWGGHVRGAILAPMSQFQQLEASLPTGQLLAIYCAAGARSWGIAEYLRRNGRTRAWSVPEGFSGLVDAGVPWLQPATGADWNLLDPAALTPAEAELRGLTDHPVHGTVQSVERTESGNRISLRTPQGAWIVDLHPEALVPPDRS